MYKLILTVLKTSPYHSRHRLHSNFLRGRHLFSIGNTEQAPFSDLQAITSVAFVGLISWQSKVWPLIPLLVGRCRSLEDTSEHIYLLSRDFLGLGTLFVKGYVSAQSWTWRDEWIKRDVENLIKRLQTLHGLVLPQSETSALELFYCQYIAGIWKLLDHHGALCALSQRRLFNISAIECGLVGNPSLALKPKTSWHPSVTVVVGSTIPITSDVFLDSVWHASTSCCCELFDFLARRGWSRDIR